VSASTSAIDTCSGPQPRRIVRCPRWRLLCYGAILCLVLLGCERKQETPTPVRKGPAASRPPAPSARSVAQSSPPVNPRLVRRLLASSRTTFRSDTNTFVPAAAGTNWIQTPPSECRLPFYQLAIDSEDLRKLDRSPRSNETFPATFVANGEVYEGVRVRYRGDWARTWPKKALKIFFKRDQLFEGQECLNLNSAWRDPAFVREPLAYHVYAACGAPAPRSRMIRLHLNGRFRGLYVEVEQPEKSLLQRLDLKGASVFKAVSRSNQADERNLGDEDSYRPHYERETRKTEGFGTLHDFCRELERGTNTHDFFTRHVEVDPYVNYLAASVLVQNWDAYNKNHFLIRDDRGSEKWRVVPWDLDRTFGDHWHQYFDEARLPILLGTRQSPGPTGWNRMADRFLSEPALRARFLDRLQELLTSEFTPEKLFPVIDRYASEIGPEAVLDRRRWGGRSEDLRAAIAELKRYVEERRAYLLRELPRLRHSEPKR
jgi:spore coat protein H